MKKRIIMVAACFALAGCGGGGGSNDNGVSFSFLGVFQEIQEQVAPAADTPPTVENHPGDTGREIRLEDTTEIPDDRNGDGDLDGGYLGMQNNMTDQAVNVEGVTVKIVVPGAVINPVATDFVPLGIRLGPAVVPEGEVATNIAFAQTIFVQPDVMAFLNQNPSLLPTPPYTMNIVLKLTGTSESGDSFDSNEFTYAVSVLPNAVP